MHASLPFQVTSEAQNHIRKCLRQPPGMQATLFFVHGFEERDEDGRLTAQFAGDHFIIGYHDSGEVTQWPQFVISESSISIDADTLGHLRGKTLTLKKLDPSCDFSPDVFSEILVTA